MIWPVAVTDRLRQGTIMCFLLLSLFPPSHSPLCCDLSSGIQVNKCHIFQPIFTLGNVPSPSPLSFCSCFWYQRNHSHPHAPKYPFVYPSQPLRMLLCVPTHVGFLARTYGEQQRRGSPRLQPLPSRCLQSHGRTGTGVLKSLSNHARVNQPCKQCHKVPGLIARWGAWLVRVRVQREREATLG